MHSYKSVGLSQFKIGGFVPFSESAILSGIQFLSTMIYHCSQKSNEKRAIYFARLKLDFYLS